MAELISQSKTSTYVDHWHRPIAQLHADTEAASGWRHCVSYEGLLMALHCRTLLQHWQLEAASDTQCLYSWEHKTINCFRIQRKN